MNHLCKDTRMASGANCADACLFKTHQKSQSKGNLSLTSSKFIYIYTLCLSCVTDFYAWLCLIISQGQCQKSTNCAWLFKRLQLPGMLLKASAFLSRFVLLQLILFLILFQFVQCLKLWYIVIVSNCVLFFFLYQHELSELQEQIKMYESASRLGIGSGSGGHNESLPHLTARNLNKENWSTPKSQ